MRFGIDVGGEIELKLDRALLLYRNEQSTRHMATVHRIVQTSAEGAPLLGSGELLTTAVLRDLTRTFGSSCQVEFLPERVVARSAEVLAWWTPSAVRPMFFREGSELAQVSGQRFPHPALLFAASSGTLCVRALRSSSRPKADAQLFAAPYWNTANDGAVCVGTMRRPRSENVASIAAWELAFFQSEFTHPGSAGRLTKKKGGTVALWKSLANKPEFPVRSLLETEALCAYLRKLEAGR